MALTSSRLEKWGRSPLTLTIQSFFHLSPRYSVSHIEKGNCKLSSTTKLHHLPNIPFTSVCIPPVISSTHCCRTIYPLPCMPFALLIISSSTMQSFYHTILLFPTWPPSRSCTTSIYKLTLQKVHGDPFNIHVPPMRMLWCSTSPVHHLKLAELPRKVHKSNGNNLWLPLQAKCCTQAEEKVNNNIYRT